MSFYVCVLIEVHPEPDATGRSRVSSFTSGFKRPFKKKNKDSPKTPPKVAPKGPPVSGHRRVEATVSSPLTKSTSDKPETVTKLPTTTPKPRRPPPPVPPAPYRKKTAHVVKTEETDASTTTEIQDGRKTESTDDNEQLPSLYEVPISQHSTLQTISEVEHVPSEQPVAPPRRRKREGMPVSPKMPGAKPYLGRIPKAPSAPALSALQSNGDSPIAKRKTSDVVVSVQPPIYTELELVRCTVSTICVCLLPAL